MSLNWNFQETVGTVSIKRPDGVFVQCKLYQGNAFLLVVHEWMAPDGNQFYEVVDFWVDRDHAKRVLNEGYHVKFYEGSIWTLDALSLSYAPQIAKMIMASKISRVTCTLLYSKV